MAFCIVPLGSQYILSVPLLYFFCSYRLQQIYGERKSIGLSSNDTELKANNLQQSAGLSELYHFDYIRLSVRMNTIKQQVTLNVFISWIIPEASGIVGYIGSS